MNKATRDAILRGVSGAAEAHDAFGTRQTHDSGLRPIGVFEAIAELQIPLMFEELDALLGACVRINSAAVGILVTTQRDLHMQRFTAAHELGHFVLGHEGSLDREVRVPGHTSGRDLVEVEADAFAAEFLMPKWLVKATAQKRAWWATELLQDPETVYQLSLRLASSYEAACWGLAAHEFIEQQVARDLVGDGKRLKQVKRRILNGIELQNSWADVWRLGKGDNGAVLEAGPDDVFVIELDEQSAAGFRWNPRDVTDQGLEVLEDASLISGGVVGGSSQRRLAFRAPAKGTYHLKMSQRRSFAKSGERMASDFQLAISTAGSRMNGETEQSDSLAPTIH